MSRLRLILPPPPPPPPLADPALADSAPQDSTTCAPSAAQRSETHEAAATCALAEPPAPTAAGAPDVRLQRPQRQRRPRPHLSDDEGPRGLASARWPTPPPPPQTAPQTCEPSLPGVAVAAASAATAGSGAGGAGGAHSDNDSTDTFLAEQLAILYAVPSLSSPPPSPRSRRGAKRRGALSGGGARRATAGSNSLLSGSALRASLPHQLSEGPRIACACCVRARSAVLRTAESRILADFDAVYDAAVPASAAEAATLRTAHAAATASLTPAALALARVMLVAHGGLRAGAGTDAAARATRRLTVLLSTAVLQRTATICVVPDEDDEGEHRGGTLFALACREWELAQAPRSALSALAAALAEGAAEPPPQRSSAGVAAVPDGGAGLVAPRGDRRKRRPADAPRCVEDPSQQQQQQPDHDESMAVAADAVPQGASAEAPLAVDALPVKESTMPLASICALDSGPNSHAAAPHPGSSSGAGTHGAIDAPPAPAVDSLEIDSSSVSMAAPPSSPVALAPAAAHPQGLEDDLEQQQQQPLDVATGSSGASCAVGDEAAAASPPAAPAVPPLPLESVVGRGSGCTDEAVAQVSGVAAAPLDPPSAASTMAPAPAAPRSKRARRGEGGDAVGGGRGRPPGSEKVLKSAAAAAAPERVGGRSTALGRVAPVASHGSAAAARRHRSSSSQSSGSSLPRRARRGDGKPGAERGKPSVGRAPAAPHGPPPPPPPSASPLVFIDVSALLPIGIPLAAPELSPSPPPGAQQPAGAEGGLADAVAAAAPPAALPPPPPTLRARRVMAGARSAYSSRVFSEDDALSHLIRIGYHAPVFIEDQPGRGRVVTAAGMLPRGAFVVEYSGQLIDGNEAERRHVLYGRPAPVAGAAGGAAAPPVVTVGSYMFFFSHRGVKHCIDATAERPQYGFGRLVSHSRRNPNCKPRLLVVDGVPHIALMAMRDIGYAEELAYDYGDRDPKAVQAFEWLK